MISVTESRTVHDSSLRKQWEVGETIKYYRAYYRVAVVEPFQNKAVYQVTAV